MPVYYNRSINQHRFNDSEPDPITATLMRDPVILPTSNMRMDRAVIESHLLDHPDDPFNRAPLTIAELTPGTDRQQ